jgi:uncharacterized NAD-dependent epimerase/dehydratase family protein
MMSRLLRKATDPASLHSSVMPAPALILAPGQFNARRAKTAFGLIRGTSRYEILGVIDPDQVGLDAGVVVDGTPRGIPIFASVAEACQQVRIHPEWAIIGITQHGGRLSDPIKEILTATVQAGVGLVNGLHEPLSELPELCLLAEQKGVELLDIRKSRPWHELRFWSGTIRTVRAPRIAVLGTDCALGKRTTTYWLWELCNASGIRTEMIYTGQTGWLLGMEYGFILDATMNDFVTGELEAEIVRCDQEQSPDLILLEGQSALRNPAGPCGAEYLCSAEAKGVIFQHAPGRTYFRGIERLKWSIPSLENELALIRQYGATPLGITLNAEGLSPDEARSVQQDYERTLGLPVLLPLEEGLDRLLPTVQSFLAHPDTH